MENRYCTMPKYVLKKLYTLFVFLRSLNTIICQELDENPKRAIQACLTLYP